MDLTQVVKSRRGIRQFKNKKIPQNVVRSLLDAARWAPSAHNSQPWRFVVIDDDEKKKELANEMGKVWLLDMLNDGVPRSKAKQLIKLKNWDRITKSPAVIIACLDMTDVRRYPEWRRQKAEYLMAVQSVAAFIQTLLLIACDYGLGACWICTPLFCQNVVRKTLGLPRNLKPQAMIIMGCADNQPSPPFRKSLDEICTFNYWRQDSRPRDQD